MSRSIVVSRFAPLFSTALVLAACSADVDGEAVSSTEAAATRTKPRSADMPGVYVPPTSSSPGTFVWDYTAAFSYGDQTIAFGVTGDVPIVGDWDGDGVATPGVVRNATWILQNGADASSGYTTFVYGNPGDVPVVGDWDGNGTDTPGIVRDGAHWYLRNSNGWGYADVDFVYGNPGDAPVVGDWNGDGLDTPGVVRGTHWYLRNSNSWGYADVDFEYGSLGMHWIPGDWDGDGVTTPGAALDGDWYVTNHLGSTVEYHFDFGNAGQPPLVGHWRPGAPLPYNGGNLMLTPAVYLVFYGNWTSTQRSKTLQFVNDLSGSPWYGILAAHYKDKYGRAPSTALKLGGSWSDPKYTSGRGISTAIIGNEVDYAIRHGHLANDPNGIYLVLTSPDLAPVTVGDGEACGAHYVTTGRVWGYAMDTGCTSNDDCNVGAFCRRGTCSDGKQPRGQGCITSINFNSSPNGDVGVDAMFSTLAHEIVESVTDPDLTSGYVDRLRPSGGECGDACDQNFGATFPVPGGDANLTVHGRNYLVQMNFNPATNFCAMTP